MKSLKSIAYGVEIHSPIEFPLELPEKGTVKWRVDLKFNESNSDDENVDNQLLKLSIHGKEVILSSNLLVVYAHYSYNPERIWKVEIEGFASFSWSGTTNRIYISSPDNADPHKLAFWLLHTILPLYLLLQQKAFFLHAAGIEVNHQAILFLAPSFGGKSTITDFFIQQGHKIVSDDKVAIYHDKDICHAIPSYPYRRPQRRHENLGLHASSFSSKPLSVQALYLLNRDDAYSNVTINRISGLRKFKLLQDSYLYAPATITHREIRFLLQISKDIKMHEANISNELHRLPEVYRAILDHSCAL